MTIPVTAERLPGSDPAVPLPSYESAGAAGLDIRANFPEGAREGLVLAPGARALVPTGLRLAVPPGHEIQVRPRSGLALRHGVTLLNSPGTIDSDYRGEIGIILINLGAEPFRVRHGERLAQLVPAPVARALVSEGRTDATERGGAGFGSTGRG